MNEIITFQISKENKEKIRERAEVIGLGMAGYCRHIVLREILKEDSSE